MPENDTIAAATTEKPTPIISKAGKVERIPFTIPQDNLPNENADNILPENVTEGANATTANEGGAADDKNKATPPAPTFTDEELKIFFESKGINYEGLDKLKEKINSIPTAEPTPEQKEAITKAQEKRRVDIFISGGGTIDQYVALKQVAEADVAELSKNTLKKELNDAGFDEKEIDSIIKERYYQIAIEELEQDVDEDDEAFEKRKNAIKRKKEYGDKLLSNRSLPIKTQAAGILADLNSAIESEDLQRQNEIAISAKIDEDFKALPRKLTFEIGDIGGTTTSPVEYDVSETDLAEVKEMLKDPAKRQQFLYNQDGSLNITNLTNVLTRNKILESASKISFLTGMTKGINDALKNFKGSPQELGVGGIPTKPTGQKGQPASYGKVQRVQPQR